MLATWIECVKRANITNFLVIALDEETGAFRPPFNTHCLRARARCALTKITLLGSGHA